MATPVVRIIMPAYNAARYIEPAVRSIQAQSLPDWELVVVDDGSTDNTVEIVQRVKDPRIRVIRQANAGPEAARQRGLVGCEAEFVARMDADDLMTPNRLQTQVDFLRRHPDVGAVGGQIMFLSEDGARSGFPSCWPLDHEHIVARFLAMDCGLCNATLTCRRTVQEKVPPTPQGGPGADVGFVLGLGRVAPLANLPEVVHYVRIHDSSIQSSPNWEARVMRKTFAVECARAAIENRPAPEWPAFEAAWRRRGFLRRLNDRREARLARLVRASHWHILNRRGALRGRLFMLMAAALGPDRVVARLLRKARLACARN